tara:strand:- start:1776 stop:3272 length:1497 start_codon:yes stop_codon:yes gene_type:complete
MKHSIRAITGLIGAVILTGCGGGSSSGTQTVQPTSPPAAEPEIIVVEKVSRLLETNADIALAAYNDSVDTAKNLKEAIDTFGASPTQANLDAAKKAWLVSREPYGQTEVYRFRLSPIDSTDYASEDGPEGEINAWPLGEALIDYVQAGGVDFGEDQVGVTTNGAGINGGGSLDGTDTSLNIIADTSITIDATLLTGTASADDEHDVIAGYHAIEFMLWGQDLNNDGGITNGADRDSAVKANMASNLAAGGQRPLTDFTTDELASRRITFLQVVAEKLIADLEAVRDGWLDDVADNYRDKFTAVADRDEALQKLTEILTGMGTLSEGELAGERMQISYSSNSQEDEHSCFSDNTHRDIWLNAEGISNSYFGVYAGYDADLDGTDEESTRAVDGYGFDDYVAELEIDSLSTLVSEFETLLSDTETNYMEIDSSARAGTPVDVLIMDANRSSDNPMYKTIISLSTQSAKIAELAEALEISADVVDDDASGCDTSSPSSTCG